MYVCFQVCPYVLENKVQLVRELGDVVVVSGLDIALICHAKGISFEYVVYCPQE
jgi:hypothetical protein